MSQEPDIEKIRTRLCRLLEHEINTSDQIQLLSAYISNYDVQQLIKWNRRLAIATFVLAIATVILAYITYLKP
jgi:hypothetical protein